MRERVARAGNAVKAGTARARNAVSSTFDLRDAITCIGVTMIAYGGNMIYPGAGWLIAGGAVFWIAIRGT